MTKLSGTRVSTRRTELGLSQRRLAANAGLTPIAINRIETGKDTSNMTLGQLFKLASVLDLPASQLFTDQIENDTSADIDSTKELTVSQARLLRKIQQGRDIRRSLSSPEREFVLPSLMHLQLVSGSGQPHLTRAATAEFSIPQENDPDQRQSLATPAPSVSGPFF